MFNTLKDLEKEGLAVLQAEQKRIEDDRHEKAIEEATSKARMGMAVLDFFKGQFGLENTLELDPIVSVDARHDKRSSFVVTFTPKFAPWHPFKCELLNHAPVGEFDLQYDRGIKAKSHGKAFVFTWRSPTFYTFGEALAVARDLQERDDKAQSELEVQEANESAEYEQRKADCEAQIDQQTDELRQYVADNPATLELVQALDRWLNVRLNSIGGGY